MFRFFRLPTCAGLLLGASLLLTTATARAQMAIPAGPPASRGYDFLTVTTTDGAKAYSFLLFSPAFQGKTEIQLESGNVLTPNKIKERIQQNTLLINAQLSALTVAGWELVQIYTPAFPASALCYLFRKAKS